MNTTIIGIPNRSSSLHIAAISALISAGYIDSDEYHPAKLFYEKNGISIVLARCDQLCKLFKDKTVDIIFTGGDYYREHCGESMDQVYEWNVLECHLAIMGFQCDNRVQKIYTKFPMIAEGHVDIGGDIISVSGSCETYTIAFDELCFDVICTGSTSKNNKIPVIKQFFSFTPVWVGKQFIENNMIKLHRSVSNQKLTESLRSYYSNYYLNRDDSKVDAIEAIIALST
jgi:ATP phosphoribosyltransferase